MHGDDAGMVEAREQLSFAIESFGECGIGGERLRENFQRDEAIQFRLPGFEDEAHAALTDEFENLELRKGGGVARCPAGWSASVGVATAAKRQRGQRPCGASGGSGEWHLGQPFEMGCVSMPFPGEFAAGGCK